MVRCATCKRELKDEAQRFCNECNRGFGKKPARTMSDLMAAQQPKRE
jgi:rRNA maturation endonuclease Nob1